MKTFKQFISEDKTSLIKNRLILPDIEDNEEKEKFKLILIDFFKKHPNYENKIDWNKAKTLTKSDFEEVLSLEDTSKTAQRKKEKQEIASDIKNIFKSVGDRKFKIVGENDKWLFVAPLTYEAAVYMDSSENQGAGAKWCIGHEKDDGYWYRYTASGSIFVMAFNKRYRELSEKALKTNLKYMIQKDRNEKYHVWSQADKDRGEKLKIFGTERKTANEMFSKAKKALEKEQQVLKDNADEKVEEIFKTVAEINKNTIPGKYKELITKIKIPKSVTSIVDSAFQYCTSLTSVTIPDSVTNIGNDAFYGCSSLETVDIPDSVTTIGESAFAYCYDLTLVTISNSVTSIGDLAFSGCTSLKSVTIPDSVTSIGRFAFTSCWSLMSVTIGNGMKNIEDHAFYGCIGLASLLIPNSVTSIGDLAFYNCHNLTITFQKGFNRSILNKKSFDPSCKFIFKE